jgi:hypothetical protein
MERHMNEQFAERIRKKTPAPAHPAIQQAAPRADGLTQSVLRLQSTVGNGIVSRLLASRAVKPAEEDVIGPEGGPLSPDVASVIESSRGSGQQLPRSERSQLEEGFGTSFGDVRVHTDSESDALNRSMGARAFTTGSDIYFASGEYKPSSPDGQRVLGHELTHVVQQRSMGATGPMTVGAADDAHEQHADHVSSALQAAPARETGGISREIEI